MSNSDSEPENPVAELDGIDFKRTLVPVVQRLLIDGLPTTLVKSSARIGSYGAYGGGLKADLVGGVALSVRMALKVGPSELKDHFALMTHANQDRQIFAQPLAVRELPDNRFYLLMQDLTRFSTLLERTFDRATPTDSVAKLGKRSVDAVLRIHSCGFTALPQTPDPYTGRIITKCERVLARLPDGDRLRDYGGRLIFSDGVTLSCPAWRELRRLLETQPPMDFTAVPVHGDPHLGNVMVRRHGKTGWVLRLIDPNTLIGMSDSLYDLGKLLHFAEPVGWQRLSSWRGGATMSVERTGWSLTESHRPHSNAAEARRRILEQTLIDALPQFSGGQHPDAPRRLRLSVASAHLGLADLLVALADGPSGREQAFGDARFVLLYTLRALCDSLIV